MFRSGPAVKTLPQPVPQACGRELLVLYSSVELFSTTLKRHQLQQYRPLMSVNQMPKVHQLLDEVLVDHPEEALDDHLGEALDEALDDLQEEAWEEVVDEVRREEGRYNIQKLPITIFVPRAYFSNKLLKLQSDAFY